MYPTKEQTKKTFFYQSEENMKEKENLISYMLIAIAIAITFISYVVSGIDINPFHSIWSFLMFLAGWLGIIAVVFLEAFVISLFFLLSKKGRRRYFYYFSILFIIASFFSLFVVMTYD